AGIQNGAQVVPFQDSIAVQGRENERSGCRRLAVNGRSIHPRVERWWDRRGFSSMRQKRGFRNSRRFCLVGTINQDQEVAKPIQLGGSGVDFLDQVAWRRRLVSELSLGLG